MPPCSCRANGCFLPMLGRMACKRAGIWACAQRAPRSSFSRQVNEVRAEPRTLHLHASLHSAPCIMSCRVEMTIQGRGLKPLALQAPTVSTTDILPRTTADYIAHAERPACPIHSARDHCAQLHLSARRLLAYTSLASAPCFLSTRVTICLRLCSAPGAIHDLWFASTYGRRLQVHPVSRPRTLALARDAQMDFRLYIFQT